MNSYFTPCEREFMNEFLFFLSIIVYFSLLLIAYKLFGKTGLFLWTSIGMILSNIEVLKMITLFNLPLTLGNVLYGTTFLATDILSERHGKQEANVAVKIGFFTILAFTIVSQFMLRFNPSPDDFASESLQVIFGLTPRIALSGIITYVLTQKFDIWLYHKIWAKTGDRMLWLRNNGSTCISQLLDTTIFTLIAFWGLYDVQTVLTLIGTTYLIKFVISILDTPFIYIARRLKVS